MNDNEKFLKENIVFAIIPVLAFVAGIYFAFQSVVTLQDSLNIVKEKQVTKTDKENRRGNTKNGRFIESFYLKPADRIRPEFVRLLFGGNFARRHDRF